MYPKSNMLQEANIESIKDIIYFAINTNITLILFPNRDHLRLQSKEHETLSNLGQLDDKHDWRLDALVAFTRLQLRNGSNEANLTNLECHKLLQKKWLKYTHDVSK